MANLCTLRNRRLQDIAGHMYKVKNNICPKHIADLFQRTDTKYLLRNEEFVIPRLNTITHRKHSIRYIGPKLWNILPKKIMDFSTLSVIKQHILQLDLNCRLADAQGSNCTLCSA